MTDLLEFIQILGNEFGINNKIIFVDSSSGEVERPSTKKTGLIGISDLYDNLKFDLSFSKWSQRIYKLVY